MNILSDADRACLIAAKPRGLRCGDSQNAKLCPGSAYPTVGWWARSSWSEWDVDQSRGGPWSVERVHRLCEAGLLGVHRSTSAAAALTKAGRAAIKPSPKTTHETPASILSWARATFGPATNRALYARLLKEVRELGRETRKPEPDPARIRGELGDVYVMLAQIAALNGVDPQAATDAAMVKNRARRWTLAGDGTGQHVEDGGEG